MRFLKKIFTGFLLACIISLTAPAQEESELQKSAYFAFVGREYIFTIEVVKAGTPLLNFVSMTDREEKLDAKKILLFLGNRQAAVKLFFIEVDRYQQPLIVSSMRMHPRSSFGFRLQGNFGKTTELHGVEINLGRDTFKLAPLNKFDFETLVRKVNRLNLDSPDFRDDYRVLSLNYIGSRSS